MPHSCTCTRKETCLLRQASTVPRFPRRGMRVSSQSFSSAPQVFISCQRGSSPQRSDDHDDISLSLSPSLARACSPLAEEFLSCCGSPPVPRSPTTLRRLWSMTDKSCRLSRSPRPRKGRRRSLRAGSGGTAQYNGAPLHDRSLARAFVHLLPSVHLSPRLARCLCVCAYFREKQSLSPIETPNRRVVSDSR